MCCCLIFIRWQPCRRLGYIQNAIRFYKWHSIQSPIFLIQWKKTFTVDWIASFGVTFFHFKRIEIINGTDINSTISERYNERDTIQKSRLILLRRNWRQEKATKDNLNKLRWSERKMRRRKRINERSVVVIRSLTLGYLWI